MAQYLLISHTGFCIPIGEDMEQFHNSARNSSQSQSNQNLMLVYLPCLMPVGPLVGHIPQQLNSPTQAPVSDQAAMSSELLPLIKEEYQSTDKPFESTVKKEPELDDLNQDTTPIIRHKNRTRRIRKRSDSQTKGNYSQNCNRNVFPNMARLIINFVCLRKKSQKYVEIMFPELGPDQVNQFYRYARRFKNKMKIYIPKPRLFEFLGLEPCHTDSINLESGEASGGQRWQLRRLQDPAEIQFKKIIRALAYQFLQVVAVPAIICSKKMKPQLKYNHLLLRRQLISVFSAARPKH